MNKRLNIWVLALVSLTFFVAKPTLYSQIQQGGSPVGLELEKLNKVQSVNIEVMPSFDIEALRAEDALRDGQPGQPWRFGHNHLVNLNMKNSGSWNKLEDGSKLWRLGIESTGALSINLAFDDFRIPDGSKLFIYTTCGTNVQGAFTSFNNQDDGYFATAPILGDAIVIEYIEPATVDFSGYFNLYRVTHGYRGMGELTEKGFGHSGACNMNVACPAAEGWDKQIRSVAKILRNDGDWCTGAMINNTENDGKPYFLSANHCFAAEGSLVFIFNWQSPTCANPPTAPPVLNSLSGAVTRARNSTSDVWLLEFNNPVPEDFNVYFAGWNRELGDAIPGLITGVHHPSGDIKKFSYTNSGVTRASYLGAPNSGTSHWRITWDGGTTTEGGSSGSPLFDSDGRIIGQLHGGYAACGNTQPDWYGRFGVSMNNVLSPWLDPNNSGVVAINGYDPLLDATPPEAPAAVIDLIITPANEGLLEATLTWTNPSQTFAGDPLAELNSINIYRDEVLIQSIDSPQIGGEAVFSDLTIQHSNFYTYIVRGENSAGEGPIVEVEGYVGYDRPGPVADLNLEAVGNDGLLTWSPPIQGQHNGYFQASSITHYQITRNPDNAVFQAPANAVDFLDTNVPIIGFYTYSIAGVNQSGVGEEETSNPALLASEGAVFMANGSSTTCNATFFDSGGPDGNYQNNENLIYTFHPGIENSNIRVEFLTFNLESHWNCNYDRLLIYDGPNTESTLLGRFCGTNLPGPFIASNGPLTFHFISDIANVRAGWSAVVSCYGPFHDVSFTVSGPDGPIEGAFVIVDDQEVYTNENGIAILENVQEGERQYSVFKEGYLLNNGTVNVVAGGEYSIVLSKYYALQFNVMSGQSPIEGAIISINDEVQTTDNQGTAFVSLVNGTYGYNVEKSGYQSATGQVTIDGQSSEVDVNLHPLYTVTFQVATSGGPLLQAEVKVGGHTLHTNNTGHTNVQLIPGTYDYEVKYLDFPLITGSITVINDNLFVGVLLETSVSEITLQEVKIFPNPFGARLFLNGTTQLKEVTITNIAGQEVVRATNQGGASMEVQTGHLPVGVYLVRLIGKDNEVFTHKVVKQ